MDGYFSKKKFFFFLRLPLGWRKFSVLRGWNKVEEQMGVSPPSRRYLPPGPPAPLLGTAGVGYGGRGDTGGQQVPGLQPPVPRPPSLHPTRAWPRPLAGER